MWSCQFLVVLATLSITVISSPTRIKRAINCTPTDDDGSALTESSADGTDFATCTYRDAGPCTYFFADGSFSSGSSTCPQGLPQNASGGSSSTGGDSSSTGSSQSISSDVRCTPTDDDGSALTASSTDSKSDFATCTYQSAGTCTYFFADGSFSSGSSTCPQGLPQTGGNGGGGNQATTTKAQTTTAAPPPPPTTTAKTTFTPPAETTTSTPPAETTSEAQETTTEATSTSTVLSTVLSIPPTSSVEQATIPTSAPAVPTTSDIEIVTVTTDITASAGPTDSVANTSDNTSSAAGRGHFSLSAAGALPLAVFVWALL